MTAHGMSDEQFLARLEGQFALYRINLRLPIIENVVVGEWYRVDLLLVNELGLFRRADLAPDGMVRVRCALLRQGQTLSEDKDYRVDIRPISPHHQDNDTRSDNQEAATLPGFRGRGKGGFEYRLSPVGGMALSTGHRYLHIVVDQVDHIHDRLSPSTILPLVVGPINVIAPSGPPTMCTFAPIEAWPENTAMVHTTFRSFPTTDTSQVMIHESWDAGIPGKIWDSAVVMLTFVANMAGASNRLRGKHVVDLSAGTGLLGLYLADLADHTDPEQQSSVTITELDEALPLIQQNVRINPALCNSPTLHVKPLLWGDAEQARQCGKADVILASDVLYEAVYFEALVQAFVDLSTPQTVIYMGYKRRGLDSKEEDDFWSLCRQHFTLELVTEQDHEASYIPPLATQVGVHIYRLSGLRSDHPTTTPLNTQAAT